MQIKATVAVPLFLSLAQAQLDQVPKCATQCLLTAVTDAGCDATDLTCLCSHINDITSSVTPCLAKADCSESDLKTVQGLTSLCPGSSGSATGGSATGTATGSATGSATGEESATGSITSVSVTESVTTPLTTVTASNSTGIGSNSTATKTSGGDTTVTSTAGSGSTGGSGGSDGATGTDSASPSQTSSGADRLALGGFAAVAGMMIAGLTL